VKNVQVVGEKSELSDIAFEKYPSDHRAVLATFGIAERVFAASETVAATPADETSYLLGIQKNLQKKWPGNRTVNLVFHGHSVPAGYFKTPVVDTLHAYPHLVLEALKAGHPFAVVNAINTSVGGENAEQGARRFQREVLTHRPDVLFIDYALNDRGIGLKRARVAWQRMIDEALAANANVKIVLLTPTPDQSVNILDDNSPLAQHAQQIRELAAKNKVALVDSYAAFVEIVKKGGDIKAYMSQVNHPNEKGHRVVVELVMRWFGGTGK
jgi:lysophospholipase L1-like esterase